MVEMHLGLKDALRPDWGGGAFGYVVAGGDEVGNEVGWVDSEE